MNDEDVIKYIQEICELRIQALQEKHKADIEAKNKEIDIYKQQADIYKQQAENYRKLAFRLSERKVINNNKVEVRTIAANELMSEVYKSKYDQSHAQIGGIVDTAQAGSSQEFTQYNYPPEPKQTLVEAAAEIQQLLKQLSQTYPTNTTAEQMMVATKAVEQIESNPDLKQKVINAAKEGGLAALEKALDNPIGALITGAIKGWLEAKAE